MSVIKMTYWLNGNRLKNANLIREIEINYSIDSPHCKSMIANVILY